MVCGCSYSCSLDLFQLWLCHLLDVEVCDEPRGGRRLRKAGGYVIGHAHRHSHAHLLVKLSAKPRLQRLLRRVHQSTDYKTKYMNNYSAFINNLRQII